MRIIFLTVISAISLSAHAAPGDVSCVAEQFEVATSELRDHVKRELKASKEGPFTFYTTEINGHAYTLNPNLPGGEYMLTISWGENWTSGVNTTGTFGASKRMQLSFVDKTKVFKLVCFKE